MKILFLVQVVLCFCCCLVQAQINTNKLWFNQPAKVWIEAIPLGNGRLGAMIFGNPTEEHIALNESTLWCGKQDESQNKSAGKGVLDTVYQLYYENELDKAQDLIQKRFLGNMGTFGTHLPLGDLIFKCQYPLGEIKNYKRELDFANSLAMVDFEIDKTKYHREIFVSNPDQIIVIKFSANKKNAINQIVYTDILRKGIVYTLNNLLILRGNTAFEKNGGAGSVNYYAIVNVKNNGGTCINSEKSIKVSGANDVVITIAINTDYMKKNDPEANCKEQITKADNLQYNQLYLKHLTDYKKLFNRVNLELKSTGDFSKLPTDKRIKAFVNGAADPQLCTIFFQYGRYLLISGSRENSPLPMNLQGIWNDNRACQMQWTCDFHLDINVQQNYWPTEVCNLSESTLPLIDFVQSIVEPGRRTAKTVFGCNGWLTNTMANAWGYTTPNYGFWGFFPEASSWIGSHLWEHYLFTQDIDFLRNKAYPILKENAEFFLDYLRVNPKNGYLMGPSASPENVYFYKGKTLAASNGPTVQSVLTNMLFSSCIEASKILNTDNKFREKLVTAKNLLPPLKIGSKGQLQEWFEDFEEAVPNHRHTSHLIALYPGSLINSTTPELEKAAVTTINNRMGRNDFEDVEWVRGNMINYFARLRQGDEALKHLMVLFKKHCSPTFLSFSAAGIAGATEEIFIIDGTTAATAGIAEMLLQSQENYIELLPALPLAWTDGKVKGLCARGGFEVSMQWENHQLIQTTIYSKKGKACSIINPWTGNKVLLIRNGKKAETIDGTRISFNTAINETVELKSI